METLEVVAAYTLTADGQRHDVAPDRIYTRKATPAPRRRCMQTAKCASSCSPTGAGIARGV